LPTKVPVSERALIARINRKLKQEGRQLKTKRGNWREDISGPYYVLDVKRNAIVAGGSAHSRVDLEKLGRECGALEKWEVLEAE
jgi:hypothetical protein